MWSIYRWDFPWNKPSSYWGLPILGNPQILCRSYADPAAGSRQFLRSSHGLCGSRALQGRSMDSGQNRFSDVKSGFSSPGKKNTSLVGGFFYVFGPCLRVFQIFFWISSSQLTMFHIFFRLVARNRLNHQPAMNDPNWLVVWNIFYFPIYWE